MSWRYVLVAVWRALHPKCPHCEKGRVFFDRLEPHKTRRGYLIDLTVYRCDCCDVELV